MKRKIIEDYIDKWLDKAETIADLASIDKAARLRQDLIFHQKEAGKLLKKEYRDEFQKLQFLKRRIEITLPVMLQEALDKQEYLLLPEHDRCGIVRYRYLASFKITPQNIKRIKGYHLFEDVGLYHPTENPNGVVRDHRLSVKFGFDNKIDPDIVGHVANCEFLKFSDNGAKSSTCSVSLSLLQDEIKAWTKYESKKRGESLCHLQSS